jgi:D-arabinose 1-dehydrogenase-like Zn-dependent alcohol dehydrogenase
MLQSTKDLKNVGALDFRAILKLAFSKCESLDDYREISKMTRLEIFNHPDYVKPQTAAHVAAQKEDTEKIMITVMGKNKAYQTAVKLIKEDKIKPLTWCKETHHNSENQINFVLKSYKNLFFFVKDSDGLDAATPRKIVSILARAAAMKPENFARAISKK